MKDIKHIFVLECQTWHRNHVNLALKQLAILLAEPSPDFVVPPHSVAVGSHQRWETLLPTHTSYHMETLTPQAGSTLDLFSFEWFLEREIQKKISNAVTNKQYTGI